MQGTPEHAIAQRILLERARDYLQTDIRLVWAMVRSARALGPMGDALEALAREVEKAGDRAWMAGAPEPKQAPRAAA
jgi:hypothetical protein